MIGVAGGYSRLTAARAMGACGFWTVRASIATRILQLTLPCHTADRYRFGAGIRRVLGGEAGIT